MDITLEPSARAEQLDDGASLARKACVGCKRFQPRGGRLLRCLHVICGACALDCVTRDAIVICAVCFAETPLRKPDVPPLMQLLHAEPMLYKTDEGSPNTYFVGDSGTGSSDAAFCDACHDNLLEVESTHLCLDCDKRPLCASHAQIHSRKQRYAGHQIVKVEEDDVRSRLHQGTAVAKELCSCHPIHPVLTFCKTCSCTLCEKCLAGDSHTSHIVGGIASSAARKRNELQTALDTDSKLETHMSQATLVGGKGFSTVASVYLDDVSSDIEAAKEDAQATSDAIAKVFDDLESLLKARRLELLDGVDTLLGQKLDHLQSEQRRLAFSLQCHSNAVDIAQRLAPRSSEDLDVVLAAELVKTSLVEGTATFVPMPRGRRTEFLEDMKQDMITAASRVPDKVDLSKRVHMPVPRLPLKPDLTKSIVKMPQSISLSDWEPIFAILKLLYNDGSRVPNTQPIPAVTASLHTESKRNSTTVKRHEISNLANGTFLKIRLAPRDTGQHTLVLSLDGQEKRESFVVDP